MALFKKKVNVPEQPKLFSDSIDYRVYRLKPVELAGCVAVGALGGFLLGEIFYGMLPVCIVLALVCAIAAVPLWKRIQMGRRSKALKVQFRDMLESVATSIGAGQNITDSFVSAYGDMRMQYSDDAYIVKELRNIVGGMNNNMAIEDLLNDFGNRSGLEDAQSFASVFETTYRKGGDIKEVVKSTYNLINEKTEVDLEIQTMMASANAELNMMLFMPVVIILMLRFMGGGISNQGSMVSVISTTVALVIFAVSYLVGKKIMNIKL